ncbi:MAG TPA: hypothetical protein DDW49_06740 [Deltaproteobacteria bacterium]|nr:MAG: hypothetical protein A2048_02980 [Deltaproteobacteria bacterium GWA2_45_12]HBF13067.1 hypothetical protein [Deltaproteobacteria bacterium]
MRHFRVVFSFLVIVSVYFQASCTPKQIASDITSQIMKGGAPSFEMESDVGIGEEAGLTMLKMMETFQHDNPKNKNYLLLLSRSYANYAFGFLEWNMQKYQDVDPEKYELNKGRAQSFYLKGKDYGMRLLERNAGFEKTINKDLDSFKKSLKGMGRKFVPALFFTALNWGAYINLNKDSPLAIAEFPKAEAMMERVVQLDDNFFYGGPNMFMGFSFGSRPQMFGGNPQKSKEYFEKALAAYQRKFLLALVMYAQSYAVQTQDEALYESLLNEVLAAPNDILPEQRLGNEIAKLRARWLLDHKSNYF